MKLTRLLPVLIIAVSTLPVAAQTKNRPPKTRMDVAIERAVAARQQEQQPCTCNCQQNTFAILEGELTPDEMLDAEIELQRIRDLKDSTATFDKYPYLLDPAYHRKQQPCPCHCGQQKAAPQTASITPIANEEEELSTQELIAAEEELNHIRSVKDSNATFDKYPYLLDPEYRRTDDEQVKAKVRLEYKTGKRSYTPQPKPYLSDDQAPVNATWARKVGL